MTKPPSRDTIVKQALALPVEDRAYIIEVLQQSIRSDSSAQAELDALPFLSRPEFIRELERRSAAFRREETTAESEIEVIAELRAREASAST